MRRQRWGLDWTIFWWGDHVRRIGTTTAYHEPFVLLGFLSCCSTKIGFASGILILAQRQAALVAKQAASLDELCRRRFRLGIGVGWNEIEFQDLGLEFRTRGRRSEERVRFMQGTLGGTAHNVSWRVPPAPETWPRFGLVRRSR
jgi:alkanesulfonate monooxygenase SsuD/methylene tetrahydromethanopterin reductase-like flavin-dependent oxidoreductase (luciferase family)